MGNIIKNFNQIAHNYKAIFCDLWGCIHNGRESFKEGLEALLKFRNSGGYVILVTNAPRPSEFVTGFLDKLGITKKFYDAIVTSGDATKFSVQTGDFGYDIYHIGPTRDLCFFNSERNSAPNPTTINLVSMPKASSIICTGLFNDLTETPENYSDLINFGVKQKLKLLCANPDMKVDFGRKRIWCAGGIAKKYSDAGGKTFYFGKPYSAIYEKAFQKLKLLKKNVERKNILCIGDGINTDIKGGIMNGFKTLFICGGLSNEELQVFPESPEPQQAILERFLESYNLTPTAAIGYLQ